MARELTLLQSRFVAEYIRDFNGVQAATRAGYSGNYQVRCQAARDNLRLPEIQKAVEEAKAERSKRCKVTGDQVVGELMGIAMDPKAQRGVRISALKEVSRMCGLGERQDDDLGAALAKVAEALK